MPIAEGEEALHYNLIRITVATNPLEADADPSIGIQAGGANLFYFINNGSPDFVGSPCYTWQDGEMDGNVNVPYSAPGHRVFTMTFHPVAGHGTCSTNNGYEMSAAFKNDVHADQDMDLVMFRDGAEEQYILHYIIVEFL